MNSKTSACTRCRANVPNYYQLACRHTYCLICCAYRYTKQLSQGNSGYLIQCQTCHKITELEQQTLNILNNIIQTQIIPKINKSVQQNQEIPKRVILRQQNKVSIKIKSYCIKHKLEIQQFNCMTCKIHGLCWKCISSGEHRNHQLESINLNLKLQSQEIELTRFQVRQKIQQLVMKIQRINLVSQILSKRNERIKFSINEQLKQLIKRAEQKQLELRKQLEQYMCMMQEKLNSLIKKCQLDIEKLRNLDQQLQNLTINKNYNSQIISQFRHSIKCIQKHIFKQSQFLDQTQNVFDYKMFIPVFQNISKIRLIYDQQELYPHHQKNQHQYHKPLSQKQLSIHSSKNYKHSLFQSDHKSQTKPKQRGFQLLLQRQKQKFRLRSSYRFNV